MELGLADTVIVRSAAVANDGLQCTAVYSAAVWHWAAHVDGLLQHLEVLVCALHHRHSVDAYMRPTVYTLAEGHGVQLLQDNWLRTASRRESLLVVLRTTVCHHSEHRCRHMLCKEPEPHTD